MSYSRTERLSSKWVNRNRVGNTPKTKAFLSELEKWINSWRLTLAPHKCSQIILERSKRYANRDVFDIKIYGQIIPVDNNPKFLGICFDKSLTFKEQIKHIEKKSYDRLNVLKTLSYDKLWRIDKQLLIQIYKTLVRSVIDYSAFISTSISQSLIKKLETIHNDAMRIILRKTTMDKIPIEVLCEQTGLDSIEERLGELTNFFLEKATTSGNPLIDQLMDDYLDYRNRSLVNPARMTN